MDNRSIALGLVIAALFNLMAPGFNGFFFEPSDITDGESQIISAILISAAAIVWSRRG